MLKKNWFYLSLIVIYLLFLSKDYLIKLTKNNINIDTITESREEYYETEYKKLTKLVNLKPNNYEIIYSKIILRDIYEFYDNVTILKGESYGIKEGNIIINNDGLIGVINKTFKNYSEVNLLTNKNINISVKINNSYGILSSNNNIIYVKNIKLQNEIKEGDKVYTSGLTNTPDNILIGTVKNVRKDNLELEYILEITPSVDFHNINYVGVIK